MLALVVQHLSNPSIALIFNDFAATVNKFW